MKFKKNLLRVHKNIEKLEMAIAGFVAKPNIAITTGIESSPPPIPATLLRAMMKEYKKIPPISRDSMGNTGLWEQMPGSLTPHRFQGYPVHSSSTTQV